VLNVKTAIKFTKFTITMNSPERIEPKGQNKPMDRFLEELDALCAKYADHNGTNYFFRYKAEEFGPNDPQPQAN
jgi:hypothetical protein